MWEGLALGKLTALSSWPSGEAAASLRDKRQRKKRGPEAQRERERTK